MIHRRHALAIAIASFLLAGCASTERSYPTFPDYQPVATLETGGPRAESGEYVDVDGAANVFQQQEMQVPEPQAVAPVFVNQEPIAPVLSAPQRDDVDQQFELAMSIPAPAARADALDRAAQGGSGKAHYELAKIYTDGKVRPRDLSLAQQHLQQAASLDDPEATRVLGWQMIKGSANTAQNLTGGVAIMEMGVNKSVRAQRELGMLYANLYDDYKLDDIERGESYLISAYRAGDVPAAAALGKLYIRNGRQLEAVEPLSYASEHRDTAAQRLLASLGGNGAAANASIPAVDNSAQEASDGESFYTRASAIMMRKHSPEEEAKAYALFSIASDRGYNLAKAELAAISGVNVQMSKERGRGWLEEAKRTLAHQN